MTKTIGFNVHMNRVYTEQALREQFSRMNGYSPDDPDVNTEWGGVGIPFKIPTPDIARWGSPEAGDSEQAQEIKVYTIMMYTMCTETGSCLYFGEESSGYLYVIHTITAQVGSGNEAQKGLTLSLARITGEAQPHYFEIVQHLHTIWNSDDVEVLLSTYFTMKNMNGLEIRSLTSKTITP